jgi:hypothetical protein
MRFIARALLPLLIAAGLVAGTSVSANAVTADPYQWVCTGACDGGVVIDQGAPAFRLRVGSLHASTGAFATYLQPGGGGAGGYLTACVTYRANKAPVGTVWAYLSGASGQWQVNIPAVRNSYEKKCASFYNPWHTDGGWVALSMGGSPDTASGFIRSVTIN